MATKPFVTTSLVLHDGQNVTIADYLDNSGKFVNIGTQAAAAVGRHEAIHYVDADGVETLIPYHAIVAYNVSKAEGEYTPAEDAFCEEIDPIKAYYTVTFYNGEDVMQQGLVAEGEIPVYDGNTPTKEGYTFLGWNIEADAQTALETLPAIAADTNLYAIFEQA